MKLFIHLSLLVVIFFAAGCGSSSNTLNVNMSCDENCNGSNAVVIKIFQLKSADKFRTASFESLLRSPESVLGDDLLVNGKYEKLMVPDEDFNLEALELKPEAMYLGIFGDFHSPSKDGWQQLISLKESPGKLKIMIHENSLSVIAN